MILVTGITGQVGGAAARTLLSSGQRVRALVRDEAKAAGWARAGVELHRGDMSDPEAVAAALAGVQAAFLMLPPVRAPSPNFEEARVIIDSYCRALQRASPQRTVVLSSIGSDKSHGVGLITSTQLLETAVRRLGLPVAFVRAGAFLENYQFNLRAAAESGWFDTFLMPTTRAYPMIASEDIGREVARLLGSTWSAQRIIELGSPFSADDLARAMSSALGRTVRARSIPREQWSAVLHAQGMAEGTTAAFEQMEDAFNSGWIDFGVPGTEPVAASITPEQFFAAQSRAWAESRHA